MACDCSGNGEPKPEYACGVQVPGSKEQLQQAQKERQRKGAQGTNLSRRQRDNRNGGRGRGRGNGNGRGSSADEGVIIKGGRSSVNPDVKKGSEKPRESAEELQEKARKAKDKLLEFDRTAAKRTQVIDDQSDWYDATATSLMWLDDAERKKHDDAALAAEIAEKEEREEARKVKLSFDFAGRKIIPRINAPEEAAAQVSHPRNPHLILRVLTHSSHLILRILTQSSPNLDDVGPGINW